MEGTKRKIKKNSFKTEGFSRDLEKAEGSNDMMLVTFLGNEKEQRRVRNKNTLDEKVGEKKIGLERKNCDIQIKELSAEQRLIKSRYVNMVRRTKANEISMNEGKK
ncbi:Hypothetical predicted protein [Paramuricea clavata]|uniref:Uncharacterized protein n=1 Tax=Paramuricea clavata TaxID=317549 RepID=A0A6S7H5Z5_PARCT|nr:Hypothetical predicted protein [Paramuricea clavata]